jgi:polyferredoxin
VGEIVAKHSTWLFIAWWAGGAWMFYFADAPTLVRRNITGGVLHVDAGSHIMS